MGGKKVAIFLEDMYEDLEFWYPYYRMKEAGHDVDVISPELKTYHGKNGLAAEPNKAIDEVAAKEYDAVIIPGGYSPDKMRRNPAMVRFITNLYHRKGVIAAICHGPWMLVSARILPEKRVTSFFSIKDDIINAGASWVDEEVVVDNKLITSRTPRDLPAFCGAILDGLK